MFSGSTLPVIDMNKRTDFTFEVDVFYLDAALLLLMISV